MWAKQNDIYTNIYVKIKPIISYTVFRKLIKKTLCFIKCSVLSLLKYFSQLALSHENQMVNPAEKKRILDFFVHDNKFPLHDFNQREHNLSQISETLVSACFWREWCVGVYGEPLKCLIYRALSVCSEAEWTVLGSGLGTRLKTFSEWMQKELNVKRLR